MTWERVVSLITESWYQISKMLWKKVFLIGGIWLTKDKMKSKMTIYLIAWRARSVMMILTVIGVQRR